MKLFEPKKKIANPENVDLPEEVACGSGYSGYFLSIRIREKRLSGSTRNELLSPESCRFGREKCWIRKCRTLEETDVRIQTPKL
jgi:hypothetical protein